MAITCISKSLRKKDTQTRSCCSYVKVITTESLRQSSLQKAYGSHHYRKPTAVITTESLRQSSLQKAYGSHHYRKPTAVITTESLRQSSRTG